MLKPNCSLGDVMRPCAEAAGAMARAVARAKAIGRRRRAAMVGPRMNAPMEKCWVGLLRPQSLNAAGGPSVELATFACHGRSRRGGQANRPRPGAGHSPL